LLVGTVAAAVSAIYIIVLPRLVHGLKTYSVLILGVLAAALIGGHLARTCRRRTNSRRWILSVVVGLAVAAASLYLSLLIIVNVLGE